MSQLYLTTFYNCIQDTKDMDHTSIFASFWYCKMQIFRSFQVLHPHQRSALDLLGGLQLPKTPSCIEKVIAYCAFSTIHHIQSLHKFSYIYPIFLLLMSYNTLYFYLKLPINYPIFCSEHACRPVSNQCNYQVLWIE